MRPSSHRNRMHCLDPNRRSRRHLVLEQLETRNLLAGPSDTLVAEVRLSIVEDEAIVPSIPTDRQVLTTVAPGQTFRVEMYLTDLRLDDDLDSTNDVGSEFGTYSAYTDLTFDPDAFTLPTGTSVGGSYELDYPISWYNAGYQRYFVNADGSSAAPSADLVLARYPNNPRASLDAENGKLIEIGSFMTGLIAPGPYRFFQLDIQFQAESLRLVDDVRSINDGRSATIDVLANDELIDGTYTFTPQHPTEDGTATATSEFLLFGVNRMPTGEEGSIVAASQISYLPASVTVDNPATKQDLTVTGFTLGDGFRGILVQVGNDFRYTRVAGSAYTDEFTYEVGDGHGNTSTAKVTIDVAASADETIGGRRDNRFLLDGDGNGQWTNGVDRTFIWGSASDTLLIGDWNGDGYDEIGVRQSDGRFLLDVDGSGNWTAGDRTYFWGQPEDEPFVGDWDGDGDDEIGVRRPDGRFLLDVDGSGRWSAGDRTYFWSFPADMVLIGDWDGDGDDEIGVRRADGRFLLDVDGSGQWSAGDRTFFWGSPTDTVLIGDWDGDGDDTIGVRWADGRFLLDVDGSGRWSVGDRTFFWGSPTDTILIGDWDGDGDETIGVRWTDGRYVLDVDGSGQWSAGDRTYFWGLPTDTPIVGKWASASPLMAAEPAVGNGSLASLTDTAVAPLVETAIAAWSLQPLSAAQTSLLDQVHVQIADLPGLTLGQTVGTTITLDVDAAGWGWFIDVMPDDDSEFQFGSPAFMLDAQRRIDLLTVLAHEMGHVLGLGHDVDDEVMDSILPIGVRRLPGYVNSVDAAIASGWDQ